MRFLHAADIHLDSPMTGLPDYEGAPTETIRSATRDALENMVDLAIQRECDFVVIAGDLYDGDWKSFDTGLFFVRQMARLAAEGIKVFILHGNHDAESNLTKQLTLPEGVETFSAKKPQTFTLDDLRVALHGWSFKTRSITDNMATDYPAPTEGYFNIGVLHTAASGREGHEPYAPCSVDDLLSKGYDYWALGHVHNRELLADDPPVLFPGNLQGRNIRETAADGKGGTIVEVDPEKGAVTLEHVAVDTVRWHECHVDLTDLETLEDAIAHIRGALSDASADAYGRVLATRVVLSGRTPLHRRLVAYPDEILNEVRGVTYSASSDDIWIEKVKCRTRPVLDIEAVLNRPDALGEIARSLEYLKADGETCAAITAQLAAAINKLPSETATQFPELVAMAEDPDVLLALMDEAAGLVLGELAESGEGA